ncbi:MAG: pitrilysin family protein [Vicinamibacterales bacterium]
MTNRHARPVRVGGFAALAIAVVAGGPIGAQQGAPGPTSAGLVKMGKAPVSAEVLKVKLPRPKEADLPNGLHLIVLEDHRLPRVSFQIIIPGAGGYYDPDSQIGLASYTAQMMREGTTTRSSQQISQDLETLAANVTVNASLSAPNASIAGGALTEDLPRVMDVAADVLLNPSFPAEEWERLKTRSKAGLQQQRTQPAFLAAEMFNRVNYGKHPGARLSATVQSTDAVTRDAMVQFHRARYVPDRAAIAFAGDITLADARKLVETKLAGWKKAGTTVAEVTDPAPSGPPKIYLINRPNSVQTTFSLGGQSMKRTDPDYERLNVANRVLGGTMGRLFRHLREEKGYTYGIGSGFSALRHIGLWTGSTSVRTEVTEAALTDFLAEIAMMRDTPVPDDELADAKNAIVAGFALSLESPPQMLGYYTDNWIYGLPADYWDTYPARISAVTAADVQAAARKYWDPSRLQIVAVGDATKIAEALKKKGQLEMYDAEGNPAK